MPFLPIPPVASIGTILPENNAHGGEFYGDNDPQIFKLVQEAMQDTDGIVLVMQHLGNEADDSVTGESTDDVTNIVANPSTRVKKVYKMIKEAKERVESIDDTDIREFLLDWFSFGISGNVVISGKIFTSNEITEILFGDIFDFDLFDVTMSADQMPGPDLSFLNDNTTPYDDDMLASEGEQSSSPDFNPTDGPNSTMQGNLDASDINFGGASTSEQAFSSNISDMLKSLNSPLGVVFIFDNTKDAENFFEKVVGISRTANGGTTIVSVSNKRTPVIGVNADYDRYNDWEFDNDLSTRVAGIMKHEEWHIISHIIRRANYEMLDTVKAQLDEELSKENCDIATILRLYREAYVLPQIAGEILARLIEVEHYGKPLDYAIDDVQTIYDFYQKLLKSENQKASSVVAMHTKALLKRLNRSEKTGQTDNVGKPNVHNSHDDVQQGTYVKGTEQETNNNNKPNVHEELENNIMREETNELIEKGIQSYVTMRLKGYTDEQVRVFLTLVPMSRWVEVVNMMPEIEHTSDSLRGILQHVQRLRYTAGDNIVVENDGQFSVTTFKYNTRSKRLINVLFGDDTLPAIQPDETLNFPYKTLQGWQEVLSAVIPDINVKLSNAGLSKDAKFSIADIWYAIAENSNTKMPVIVQVYFERLNREYLIQRVKASTDKMTNSQN